MKIKALSLRKAEQGFTHILLILLVLAGVTAVGGFVFWRVSSYNNNSGSNANGKKENDSSGNNTATVSDDCVAMTHDENICHLGAIDGLDKHASVVKVTIQGADGTQNITEKFDGKGNNSVEMGDISGITVGSHYYVLMSGTWVDMGGDKAQAPSTTEAPALATTAGVKYENLGKEACGNDTCYKYRCTGGILGTSTVLVTFGTKDYLPRHYVVTTPEGGASLLGNMTMDITYGPQTITAPAGAKTMEQYQQQLVGG